MTRPLSHPGRRLLDRRAFLGAGAVGLSSLLAADANPIRPQIDPTQPEAARQPHYTPAAKRLLVIFCSGALSHVDTFDYKPELWRYDGQPLPGAESNFKTFQGENGNLQRSPWTFRPRGQCGKMTSDLLPHLGGLVDNFCFIHSLTSKTNTHGPAENFMSTGFVLDGFPSMGSWISYALGSERDNLPAYVAIPDPRGVPQSSVNNWGPGFLPAVFQGTPFSAQKPIRNLRTPPTIGAERSRAARDFLSFLNDEHLRKFPGDSDLAARIASYEMAARMQLSVPELTDLSREPASILRMYGADSTDKVRAGFARNCILARRLIESGVRVVQLFNGAYAMGEGVGNWDGHKKLKDQYDIHGPNLDQAAAALISDLKQRGLLADTLIAFVTEFGRMPTFQKGASGRDHNPEGFTVFLAGAGVRAPFSYGATDAFGHRAVQDAVSMHDFHATILHLLGLDHEALSIYHNGIQRRLTDVHGDIIGEILA
jgi:hypothetical protein